MKREFGQDDFWQEDASDLPKHGASTASTSSWWDTIGRHIGGSYVGLRRGKEAAL